MDLSKTAVAIRPRAPWEAVDMGLRMARHWWWPLFRVWLVVSLPVFILLQAVPADYLWLPPLVIWWLKPVWERPLLFILSQALFGQLPSTRETLKAFPGTARPQILAWLTWRRLSPYRAMDMPVTQLEGLAGSERGERIRLLRRQDAQPAAWLTIIGIHLEGFLALALMILAWMLVPETVDLSAPQDILMSQSAWLIRLQNAIAYLMAAVVAPFYVACGFALYLNRRIRLEGWDIEVAFRQMVQKRQDHPSHSTAGAAAPTVPHHLAALLLVGLFGLGAAIGSPPVTAAEATPAREEVAQQIREILAGEDFNRKMTLERVVWDEDEEEEKTDFDWDFSLPKGWGEFLQILASSLEFILWSLVILLIFWVVVRYRHWLEQFSISSPNRTKAQRPDTLFGLDVRRESLPDDVPAAVEELWGRDPRAAISLLYRAWLVRLIDRGVEIEPGFTEADCLQQASADAPAPVSASFNAVTRAWQWLAYAHRAPETINVHQLCHEWRQVWSQGERGDEELREDKRAKEQRSE